MDDFIDKNRNLKSNGDFNNYELITFQKMQKTNEERRKLKESNYNTKFDKEFLEVKNSIYYWTFIVAIDLYIVITPILILNL